jgi:hypothetical protein
LTFPFAIRMKNSSTRPNAHGNATDVWATVAIVSGKPLGIMPIATDAYLPIHNIHRGMRERNSAHAIHIRRFITPTTE